MTELRHPQPAYAEIDDEGGIDFVELLAPARQRWKTVVGTGVAIGIAIFGLSYLITPKFTATNTFLPPQQTQGSGAGALASLSAISGLSLGGASGTKNSPDQYVALMQSVTVSDRIIQKFKLRELWDDRFEIDARKDLAKVVSISYGKKDGLVKVDVTDTDPARAAAIANQYVDELRAMTNNLAMTEAQQRRVFFEHLMEQTRDKLAAAQTALESGGFTSGALNSEPRNAAEGYAKLRAELTAAEIKLQVLRRSLADGAPEVQSQLETVNALTTQVSKIEEQDSHGNRSGDYINRYREFKYQETLFDLFARNYESARVDEAREGALVQVVDSATAPERKSSPSHLLFGLGGTMFGLIVSASWISFRTRRRISLSRP